MTTILNAFCFIYAILSTLIWVMDYRSTQVIISYRNDSKVCRDFLGKLAGDGKTLFVLWAGRLSLVALIIALVSSNLPLLIIGTLVNLVATLTYMYRLGEFYKKDLSDIKAFIDYD